MKNWIYVLFFFSLTAAGQEIKRNELDVSSNKKQIETFPINLKASPDVRMDLALRAAGSSFFLDLSGSGAGANTINTNDQLIFLLDNDSTVAVNPTTIQDFDRSNPAKPYQHEYSISQAQLETLSQHNLQGVRKYSSDGFDDIYPDEKNTAKLKTLCAFFLQVLDREQLLKAKSVASLPAFPGGKESLLSFFNRNVKLPSALNPGEKKTILLEFRVSAAGDIADVQLRQSAGPLYDAELLRILKRMPKWKSAMVNGKPVDAVVPLQITFYQQGSRTQVQL